MFTVCSQILPTDSDPILILSGYRLATSGITFQSSTIHEMGVEVVRVLLVHRGTSHLLHNRYTQVHLLRCGATIKGFRGPSRVPTFWHYG